MTLIPFNNLTPHDLMRIENTFCTRHIKKIYLRAEETPSTLAIALQDILTDVPIEDHQLLASFGGIFVNGAPQLCIDTPLLAPTRIECYIPKFDLKHPEAFFPSFHSSWIVYQDEYIVICWKPKGLPTIPSREQRNFNLKSYVEKALSSKIHMPSRLDMSTCGIVLISVSDRANAPIQKLYESHAIQKTYHLRTKGTLSCDPLTVDAPIGKHPLHPVLRTVRDDGQQAVTHFRTIAKNSLFIEYSDSSLIEAQPVTGRTHQIRVHAAYSGISILGDNFYSGAEHAHGLHLMAYSLRFPHPITRKELLVTAPRTLIPEWAQQ